MLSGGRSVAENGMVFRPDRTLLRSEPAYLPTGVLSANSGAARIRVSCLLVEDLLA